MRKAISVGKESAALPHNLKYYSLSSDPNIFLGERSAITLRFLATGYNLHSLAYAFHVGHSTASEIVIETFHYLRKVLAKNYLKTPTSEEWRQIAIDYSRIWNSPNCIGAIDGKHISIQCPPHSGNISNYKLYGNYYFTNYNLFYKGSLYYNYKSSTVWCY